MDCPKRSAGVVAGLPDDPLMEILSRVPVKSLCRFKCVSKAWRDLIADPLHRKKLPQTLEGFFYRDEEHSDADGDGEDRGRDGGDGEDLARQVYGHFVDLMGRSVRPVDPCFSFLTELPGIENVRFLHCCNGLLLFGHGCNSDTPASYIVCNPATEQWVAVPSSGRTWVRLFSRSTCTYLTFDPHASSLFHLVQFWREGIYTTVHTYSSETRAWNHNKFVWGYYHTVPDSPNAYVNGMLYVILYGGKGQLVAMEDQLIAVDAGGNVQKVVPAPFRVGKEKFWPIYDYVGQSQGQLHYIYHVEPGNGAFDIPSEQQSHELVIWVLEDSDTQQWVLKHTVSFLELFGKRTCRMEFDYNVVAMHPDHNLVFLVQHWNRKLISYHMDSKEVRDLCTLGHGYGCITPYVPCFSELSVLENKH